MTRLSETTVLWRGLTLSGLRTATYRLQSMTGWDGIPDDRAQEDQRSSFHGMFDTPALSDHRVVTIGGRFSGADRDDLLAALEDVMWLPDPDSSSVEDLTITSGGRTLTAGARLTRFQADPVAGQWGVGQGVFAAQWRCPDPLRYGPVENHQTGFADLTGGLEFDLFTDGTTDTGYLEFGAQGSTGQVVVSNPGTAPAWDQFYVEGPTPPFDIVCVETGERLSFSRALSSGEQLLIDSATGLVGLGASAVDYSGSLTRAEWFPIPRKGSCTVAFVPQGAYDTGTLTVIHRPAYW